MQNIRHEISSLGDSAPHINVMKVQCVSFNLTFGSESCSFQAMAYFIGPIPIIKFLPIKSYCFQKSSSNNVDDPLHLLATVPARREVCMDISSMTTSILYAIPRVPTNR